MAESEFHKKLMKMTPEEQKDVIEHISAMMGAPTKEQIEEAKQYRKEAEALRRAAKAKKRK